MPIRSFRLVLLIGLVLPAPAARADDAARERFFEESIRPLLSRHCVECHGPRKQESGLRLDSAAALAKGAESGPVVVPGKPDDSRLIEVVRYPEFDVQMPPKRKLPQKDLDALVRWVRDGAHWPQSGAETVRDETFAERVARVRREHWAFRAVADPPVPEVQSPARLANPVDAFVQKRLQAKSLTLSPRADRYTQIRRLSFDLRGLPPTAEEVERFQNDARPDAWQRLVDRMLASPRFGERWGRYWLDVARYADTKGYVFNQETRYPFAYTYRDYVIRAFNDDVPYDRFVTEQLAADQLDLGDRPEAVAALGFLTVGRRFRNSERDVIDDRIDVVTRGLMALTTACARCHDHKYDPIPTADYYSLYGVFASCYEPEDPPLVRKPEPTPDYLAYEQERDKRQAALDDFVDEKVQEVLHELRTHAGDYLVQVVKQTGTVPEEYYVALEKGKPRPRIVARWQRFLKDRVQPDDPVFGPWHALAKLPQEEFAERAAAWIGQQTAAGSTPFNRRLLQTLADDPPESMYDVAQTYGDLLSAVEKQWREQSADARRLESDTDERLRQILYGPGSPTALSPDEARREFDRVTRNKARKLENEVQKWRVESPHAPPRAMVLYDKRDPYDPVVFVRGTPSRRGDRVPRRFLQLLSGVDGPAFENGSGRLELARAIADPQNPLTSRVMVNRVWMHLFGRGFVEQPDDFGLRSPDPTHPRLLDWLATDFVRHGWSTRHLIRTIVTSETYRQASLDRADAREADPDNRLLWRQNRRRLDFEAGRDALLAVSGRLDSTMFGRPVDVVKPETNRRTVYGRVNRNNLPNLHRTFDFASPDTSTASRPTTTVPQQALFGLNSPFVHLQAKAVAGRPAIANAATDEQRVRRLYRRIFARNPDPFELDLGVKYVREAKNGDVSPWVKYAQALLLTNAFEFVD